MQPTRFNIKPLLIFTLITILITSTFSFTSSPTGRFITTKLGKGNTTGIKKQKHTVNITRCKIHLQSLIRSNPSLKKQSSLKEKTGGIMFGELIHDLKAGGLGWRKWTRVYSNKFSAWQTRNNISNDSQIKSSCKK